MKLQESIIKQNPDLEWNQVVMWHQWKNLSMGRLRIVKTICYLINLVLMVN